MIDGLFDLFFDGRWSENSSCGFDQSCHDTKDCIFRVCSPYRDQYGGVFYDSCVNVCNQDPYINDIEGVICDNPSNALRLYGYRCSGYEGEKGIFALSSLQWFLILFAIVVIFLLIKRFE